MFQYNFHPTEFFRHVIGSAPFQEYCQQRSIVFGRSKVGAVEDDEIFSCMKAIEKMDAEKKEKIEQDFVRMNEIATARGIEFLTDFATKQNPPVDFLPILQISGNHAKAMWFFLHANETFNAALLRFEVQQIKAWKYAYELPKMNADKLPTNYAAWEKELCAFFEKSEGRGERCKIEMTSFEKCICFTAYLADYSMIFDSFDEATGKFTTQRSRPAFEVKYVYYPEDGQLLLKSLARQHEKVEKLQDLFCVHLLGCHLDVAAQEKYRLDLNLLKARFDPSHGPEVKEVKVKELRLSYPETEGTRITFEALRGSEKMAVYDRMEKCIGKRDLDYLNVTKAILQIRFNADTNFGNVTVTLTYPNGCDLNQTAHHEKVRQYLRDWRILHA